MNGLRSLQARMTEGAIHMLKEGIGFFMMTIGGMMGNSQDFIFPIIIIGIGAWLVLSNKED